MQQIRNKFVFIKTINGETRFFKKCKWVEVYKETLCPDGRVRNIWTPTKWID